MEALPPVLLGAIITASIVIAGILRRPLEQKWVDPAPAPQQPKRQYVLEIGLLMLAGVLAFGFNRVKFDFPLLSGISMLLGYAAAGFFTGLDMALYRERRVIQEALQRSASRHPPKRLYSITRKFTLAAFITTLFVTVILIMVLARDFAWLAQASQSQKALAQAQRSAFIEVVFIMAALSVTIANLVYSFSRNLKLLFDNETGVLQRVSAGDLSQMVPVATRDEFGFIAGHTNNMIEGLRHRTRLLTSLKLAEEVQQNLLPKQPPHLPPLEISGFSIYCDQTGGDYYDYFPLPTGRLGVVVADAADHGVGSALHMAMARALLRLGVQHYRRPAQLISTVNQHLTRDSAETGRFVTLFFVEIDPAAQLLRWVRAGHDPAQLYDPHRDQFTSLAGEGVALGLDQKVDFPEHEYRPWPPQSILIIGTDGLRETRNTHNEMFGRQRFQEAIRNHRWDSTEQIKNHIIEALTAFRGEQPQDDDITLVLIRLGQQQGHRP